MVEHCIDSRVLEVTVDVRGWWWRKSGVIGWEHGTWVGRLVVVDELDVA
jgi:hypothetical protein